MKVKGLQNAIVFGPVVSRRYGRSLGVNVLPGDLKVCSFNCPYCECGFTDLAVSRESSGAPFPTAEGIVTALTQWLKIDARSGHRLDAITLAGNGEPTLHPGFLEAMKGMAAARDEWAPGARLIVLSNATTSARDEVREGLMIADERILKLDAANDEMMRRMNAPVCQMTVDKIVELIRRLPAMTLQTTFTRGLVDNSTDEHVEQWIARVAEILPSSAQIYTIERDPANADVLPVDGERLDEIAERLMSETGVPCLVYR